MTHRIKQQLKAVLVYNESSLTNWLIEWREVKQKCFKLEQF